MACSVSCARTDISEQITMSGIAWECCPILAKPAHAVGPKLKARSLCLKTAFGSPEWLPKCRAKSATNKPDQD